MLVHIIHPDTYKARGDTLCIGSIPEYAERDAKVLEYVRRALDAQARVLRHDRKSANPLLNIVTEMALQMDPTYRGLLDRRIVGISTFASGLPLPPQKPVELSDDEWKYLQELFTTNQGLGQAIGTPRRVLFMGGLLEACVTNMACYHHDHYKPQDQSQELYYCPDLCVIKYPEILKTRAQSELDKRNIRSITFEEALALLTP